MHFATYITNFMFHLDTWDLANVTQWSARGFNPHCWNRLNLWGGNQRIPLTGVACDLKAENMGQLSNHKKSHHEEIQYNCKQCDYKATNRSSLRNNRKSLHEGIRYKCDQCKDKLVTKFPVVGLKDQHLVWKKMNNDSRPKSYFKIDRVWRRRVI